MGVFAHYTSGGTQQGLGITHSRELSRGLRARATLLCVLSSLWDNKN